MPLTTLDISKTKVTDLAPLRGLPLMNLTIGSAPVTDLKPLFDCKQLQSLRIFNAAATTTDPLKQALPNCKIIP
jgi:Leucine-rich repeat (LRR) protein